MVVGGFSYRVGTELSLICLLALPNVFHVRREASLGDYADDMTFRGWMWL